MARLDAPLAAAALRHELDLGTGYVDVFEVIRRRGIELYRAPFGEDSLEGAHLVREGRVFIFVNTSCAITRQRLTAAHELGHHMLEEVVEGGALFEANVGSAPTDPGERAAYDFARYFLMDPDGVRRVTRSVNDHTEKVAAVASHFVTSIDATAIHLAALRIISTAAKDGLLAAIRDGSLRPGAFLRQFGYVMASTPIPEGPEFDPRYVRRAIHGYRQDWISFAAFADLLGLSVEDAGALLAEHDLPVRTAD